MAYGLVVPIPTAPTNVDEPVPENMAVDDEYRFDFNQTGIVVVGVRARTPKFVSFCQSARAPLVPPPTQTLLIAKQPPAKSTPLAKVEVAEVPVTFRYVASTPAPKVEVAVPRIFVWSEGPTERSVVEALAKREVLEALIPPRAQITAVVVGVRLETL